MRENTINASVPLSWNYGGTLTRFDHFKKAGWSDLEAVSAAAEIKYGNHIYFGYKAWERSITAWWPLYHAATDALKLDESNNLIVVVGVNDGTDIAHLKRASVIGIDPCESALEVAVRHFPQHSFFKARGENLQEGVSITTTDFLRLNNQSVDGYICLKTIDVSVVEAHLLVLEMRRVLKPGKPFLFSVANGYYKDGSFVEGVIFEGNHIDNRAMQKLTKSLQENGLTYEVIEHKLEPLVFGYL